jgi:hypothetical protein
VVQEISFGAQREFEAQAPPEDPSVIPGRREAANPEYITPIRNHGFRACAKGRIPER